MREPREKRLLTPAWVVNPCGGITGVGLGAASPKDQPLAETFFALRRQPWPSQYRGTRAASLCRRQGL